MKTLRGTALVTGAGSGIGRAVALACVREGCRNIVLADLNFAGVQETSRLIKERCSEAVALAISVDVSDLESVTSMISKTVDTFGGLDYAYNVAGVSVKARVPSAEYPIGEYDEIQAINARGLLLCTQAEIKVMLKQTPAVTIDSYDARRAQRGSIVNIASTCSTSVIRDMLPYITSKHAVLGITRAAAIDHAADQIRINAVCPGLVETPMIDTRRRQEQERAKASAGNTDGTVWRHAPIYNTPMGRLALAEEVADSCIFLSSSMASHTTASIVTLDGGRSAVY